jgi:hypothetical protein
MKLNQKELISNKQWLFDFLDRANDIQATTLEMSFWHIWEARNECRNSNARPNPNRTGNKIIAYVDLIKQHL